VSERQSSAQRVLTLVAFYVVLNTLFAALYMLDHGGIENARHNRFLDHFFFSVQTMATIGYGKLTPVTVYTNTLVTIEALLGMMMMALATGLMFAKFSRPTARVLWSKNVLITRRDGKLALVLRMGNARGNQIVEAQMRLAILRDEVTAEGEKLRRLIDLPLSRESTLTFVLSWTAIHWIEPGSPLYGLDQEGLRKLNVQIIASLTGMDDTFGATVHANHIWTVGDVVWGGRFVDVIEDLPDGRRRVHFERFHEIQTVGASTTTE
jgi:inward rectifier potassium channel